MKFDKLLEIREEHNLLQKDIANLLNVSVGTYAMNEEGHDTITLKNLIHFCDYFHISVDYLFNLTDQKTYPDLHPSFRKDILCSRLKYVRKINQYTQIKIGQLLNIDHSVWCRYEQGKTLISTSFLYTFCKFFHVSSDYLLGRIDQSNLDK